MNGYARRSSPKRTRRAGELTSHRFEVPDRRVVGAGPKFDHNITGFRAQEEDGFNAESFVRTARFVKILGLWFAVAPDGPGTPLRRLSPH